MKDEQLNIFDFEEGAKEVQVPLKNRTSMMDDLVSEIKSKGTLKITLDEGQTGLEKKMQVIQDYKKEFEALFCQAEEHIQQFFAELFKRTGEKLEVVESYIKKSQERKKIKDVLDGDKLLVRDDWKFLYDKLNTVSSQKLDIYQSLKLAKEIENFKTWVIERRKGILENYKTKYEEILKQNHPSVYNLQQLEA